MPLPRTCSECPNTLSGKNPRALTCSNKCRLTRSRRQRRAVRNEEEFAQANGYGAQEIRAIVKREAPDVVTRVMKEQLAPIVREAIDEDVLRAVQGMVGLTPAAVEALEEDLLSDDKVIRQRAYTLVIKYTVGHPALVKQDMTTSREMNVHFNLPRPDPEAIDAIATEEAGTRVCDMCDTEKPEAEFAAGSDRCQVCFDEFRAKVRAQFA